MPRVLIASTLLLVLAAGDGAAGSKSEAGVTCLYLVRHAEKQEGKGADPPLTEAGRKRARALVSALEGVALDAVIATEYLRTQQTVMPVAEARGLKVRIVASGETAAFVRTVREQWRGKRVLAAAHSNTIPSIVAALGVAEPVHVEERAYGDLFIVRIDADGGATLERGRFGD